MGFFFTSTGAAVLAGVCALIAALIGIFQVRTLPCTTVVVFHNALLLFLSMQIVQHLRNYTEPMFQRYIIRIIFLVPVYAICSFASLVAQDAAIYIATARDCYEAWIIYNFMSLCLEYVGGPGAVEIKMQGVVLMPSWAACTCCLPPMQVNGQFIRNVKRGALQFVFLKPILAVLTLVLYATGNYDEGNWSPSGSYLWITIVYNITYTVALYALLLFYVGTHELLEPFRPLLKFILVKSVIFLTYWQGLLISIMVGAGLIYSAEDGNAVQNFMTCVEMLPAAIFMLFAFPWKEFASDSVGLGRDAVGHAMSLGDVVTDTMHQFAPTYQNYVLYSDGTAKMKQGLGTPDNDDGLLYDVEMSNWDDAPREPTAMGKYLRKDSDDTDSPSNQRASRAQSAAEKRWQGIQLGPVE
ncbi:Transmembrane protein 184A [Picochlorum sp. SENEW3]|nr:Transmembrane protein 184A [Picochlorum sp. SENEW3]